MWAPFDVLKIYLFIYFVVSLVGQTAPPDFLQTLTYLVLRHHPKISRVDTVRAYTFGVLYFVEVCNIICYLIIYLFNLMNIRMLRKECVVCYV